jgi:cytochrome oxidase Cu insertion factor (SCO1/SenC/PrrC family)
MGTGLTTNNPTIVAAFHAALLHQGLVVLVILALVGVAWRVLRSRQLHRQPDSETDGPEGSRAARYPEPSARRLLRVSFGLIWIFDGILQGQASMPLGMTTSVIQPAASASPSWVQHLVNAGATIWSYHPIAAPAAAVWIQIGIGVWLLVAPRGDWSRLGGVASAGWGLLVWIFGEAFGGIFAPGLTWLFGAPGAVLFYCLAGVLIALPERAWATPRLGQVILRALGLFFVGMAVLQAWPGRGFWQGQAHHAATPGTLTSMVDQMAQTPQPHLLSTWVSSFAAFDAAYGWGVNFFAVVALAGIGTAFLTGRATIVRWGLMAGVVLCLADWVFIEDFGFLGGVGTDPNSMIPMALLFGSGYLAVAKLPAGDSDPVPEPVRLAAAGRSWPGRFMENPTYAFRSIAAVGALGITLVGAAPMAVAASDGHADPILNQALNGPGTVTDTPAPAFSLIDQNGQAVSLATLHGKELALTFLDPVCTSDCPLIAQEFRAANGVLGADSRNVELVAIDANPRYRSTDFLAAFDQQEGLARVPNWLYLTGSLPQLEAVWRAFGVQIDYAPGGAMIDHSEIAYVIDASGRTREVLNTDPGPATEATQSSFAVALAGALQRVRGSS